MRSLLHRLRHDAAMRGGVDRWALEALANSLEGALDNLMAGATTEREVASLREVNALISRIHREYARMDLLTPFAT